MKHQMSTVRALAARGEITHRMQRVCRGLLACGLGLVLGGLPAVAHGQAERGAAAADAWRTPWGDPDLQGVWTTDALRPVPLERPVDLGERAELSAEEHAERAASEARLLRDDKVEVPRREFPDGGPSHWYEYPDDPSTRTSLIIDPPDGRLPPFTQGAQLRTIDPGTQVSFFGGSYDSSTPKYGPEDFNLNDRCISRGLPNTWVPSIYNNGFQVVQHPGYVVIVYERMHEYRVIPLDGRDALNPNVRQYLGDSRGRWEGDTLVVEVTNFSDQTTYRRSGAARRLTERYTRVDAGTVRVEFTVDDPTTWTRPWTAAVEGKRDPNYWQIFEYACHEGNIQLGFMISASQAEHEGQTAGGR